MKLYQTAREELQDLLPAFEMIFAPEPEIVDYHANGKLLQRTYAPTHKTAAHYTQIAATLRAQGYDDITFTLPHGIAAGYDREKHLLIVSETDGLHPRPFGHELLHPAFDAAYAGTGPAERETVRPLEEAFADTLGAICLVDIFYHEDEATSRNLHTLIAAYRDGEQQVSLPHGNIRVRDYPQNHINTAVEIAATPGTLAKKVLRARRELTSRLS